MDSLTWLRQYNPLADETLRAEGDTRPLITHLRQAADELSTALGKLSAADEAWHEQEDELQSLRGKLGACIEALECLLPGLVLDLRYADPDDDRDAMQSRINTVTRALEATK